jgi:aryl-alcohol dehydrogenase-like predicted oxidoreductase
MLVPVEQRPLGNTGLSVSALGFGCGNVGGLMVRESPPERERAVARAVELGITYFDTAPSYGDGESERNLGQALRALRADVHVGTKFRLDEGDRHDVAGAIARSLEASLARLGRDSVDLLQLHNSIGSDGLSADLVLEEVVPALLHLKEEGKARFLGITGSGETSALHRVLHHGGLDTVQCFFNLLNPSAAYEVPDGFPAQNFDGLIGHAGEHGAGVIVVRALAAGALSGSSARHPIAAQSVGPIGSGADFAADLAHARALESLITDGYAGSFVEASLRFPLATEAVSTVLLGYSSLDQIELAAASVEKGPLPAEAYARLKTLWAEF